MIAIRPRPGASWQVPWGIAGAVAALPTLAEANIAAGAPWDVCPGVGPGPVGSPGVLLGEVIAATLAQAAILLLAYRLITGRIRHRLTAAICVGMAGAAVLLLVGWGFLGLLGLPMSYHDGIGTYPHWWPHWLPPGARILSCWPLD